MTYKIGLVMAIILLTACVPTTTKKLTLDSNAFGCSLSQAFSGMSAGVQLEILQADLDSFITMIRKKNTPFGGVPLPMAQKHIIRSAVRAKRIGSTKKENICPNRNKNVLIRTVPLPNNSEPRCS